MKTSCLRIAVIIAVAAAGMQPGDWAWGQRPAAPPAGAAPAAPQLPEPFVPTPPPKPVDKIYIVGYTLMVLMIGLGVLVVCHYRVRKARPDLPQDMAEERLRQGKKALGG
jgi:hypothetical protein